MIAQTINGQLDIAWLDATIDFQRPAWFPEAHQKISVPETKIDHYQSFGQIFPLQSRFNYNCLHNQLRHLKAERIKGVFFTDKGWLIVNCVDGVLDSIPCSASTHSRIEIIATGNDMKNISALLNQCRTDAVLDTT